MRVEDELVLGIQMEYCMWYLPERLNTAAIACEFIVNDDGMAADRKP